MCWNKEEEVKKKMEELFPDFNFDEEASTLTANIEIVDNKTNIEVNSQPLFTLTAEEVEELKEPIQYFNNKLNDGWLKIDGGQYLPPYSWNKAINNLHPNKTMAR